MHNFIHILNTKKGYFQHSIFFSHFKTILMRNKEYLVRNCKKKNFLLKSCIQSEIIFLIKKIIKIIIFKPTSGNDLFLLNKSSLFYILKIKKYLQIFLLKKFKNFPHRESNPGHLRERQES